LVSKTLFSSNTEEWGTPLDLYKKLDEEFHFETDPCTTKDNPLNCNTFYTKEENGLDKPWINNTFINPPYGKHIGEWVKEARARQIGFYDYWKQRHHKDIVMLLPVRTDVKWFHDYIWYLPENTARGYIEIRFIKGRLKFVGATNPAPFPSMLVIFRVPE
jgi:site-specific DNA-methyltransferase (adenine-specific)